MRHSKRWAVRVAATLLSGHMAIGAAVAETMREAVRAAIGDNPTARAQTEEVRATAFDLLSLRGEYRPTLSLNAEAGAQWIDDPADLAPADNRTWTETGEVGVTAEIVLFDGFRRANRVYADSARLDGSILRLLDASETIALNAVQAYVDVMRHGQLLNLARANLRRHREIGEQVAELVEAGRLPVSDRFTIDQRIFAARIAVVEVERSLADAKARYEAVVGTPPRGQLALPTLPGMPGSLATLQNAAVINSHDVRAAGAEILRRRAQEGVEAAANKPRLSLRAGLRQGTNSYGPSGDETDAFVGLQLSWEFYSGGRDARADAARARTQAALSAQAETVREVRELAARAWNAYHSSLDRLGLLRGQRESAAELVAEYDSQFDAGARSLLEVLEAERTLFDIRFAATSAEASMVYARFRVLAAQSRLAAYFGARPANMPLAPGFAAAAATSQPGAVFDTVIQALE